MFEYPLEYPFGHPDPGQDVLWRCEVTRYSVVIDADAERFGVSRPHPEMQWFRVVKRTRCGARLECGRFVRLTAHKRWACQTQQEAIESFVARKNAQIRILSAKLERAKEDLVSFPTGTFINV